MPASAALLTLVLAGPALAARPPLSPAADNDAINDEITAGDPTFTTPPAPLERLLVAAELAEQRLRAAVDPDAVSDLLTLTAAARKAAYQRTGEGIHLCRLIDAAEHVLAREAASPDLTAAATDFRQEARDSLGTSVCAAPPPEPMSAEVVTAPASAVGPADLPPRRVTPVDRADRRRVRVGVGTLVPGLLLFAPMAGLLAYRGQGEREISAIRVDSKDRPLTPQEAMDATALGKRYMATTAGAVALGVIGAVLIVTGAALLATGARQRRMAVAPWGARGVGGLVLQGRF